jgi:S-DNA-T family DNA segregation ATPase FtsK/SpoIIIE
LEEIVTSLTWVTRQMDERYRLFAEIGARNVDDYNRRVARRGQEILPYIVVVVDELADLMMVSPDTVERSICRIAQMARATGIHLVMATQRPSVDVVTGLIKANFPARISFAVTSQVDSRVVLDTGGAEQLLGRGDMLYMAPDSSKLVRLQGCFVSDKEVEKLVRFWKETSWAQPPAEGPRYPWHDLAAEEEHDELLEEAIELVKRHKRASTSFLQRRLRIGYPRAARLMDTLEEQGIVGPPVSGGRSREVLIRDFEDVEDSRERNIGYEVEEVGTRSGSG